MQLNLDYALALESPAVFASPIVRGTESGTGTTKPDGQESIHGESLVQTLDSAFPALRLRVLEWLFDSAHPNRRFRFSETALRISMGVSMSHIKSVLRELELAGQIARIPEAIGSRYRGWACLGAVTPRRTLAELVDLVQQAPCPLETEQRAGRKSAASADEPLSELTVAQKRDILHVLGLVAEYAPGANGCAARVTAEYMRRTEIRDGKTVWSLEMEVVAWSELRASRKGKHRASSETRAKHVGAIRLALRFARSVGWLVSGTSAPFTVNAPAVEWRPIVARWRLKLSRRRGGRNASAFRLGLNILALYATRRGELSIRGTDWPAVLADIDRDVSAGKLTKAARSQVRCVWRTINVLSRLHPQPRMQEARITLISGRAVKRTVASLASASSAEDISFGDWETTWKALVPGPYGLKRLIWFWGGPAVAIAADPSLPERTYETNYRRRSRRLALGSIALDTRLRHFGLLAGWGVRKDGMSFDADDALAHGLRELLTSARLNRYVIWRETQPQFFNHGSANGDRNIIGVLHTVRRTLADLIMLAKHDADSETAERLSGELVLIDRMVRARPAKTTREAVDINRAWMGDGEKHGLEKLVQLRDLWTARAVNAAHDRTVEQQLEELRAWRRMPNTSATDCRARNDALAAMRWRTATWATAVRRAFLAQFIRKVPLREDALRQLTPAMITVRDATSSGVHIWDSGTVVLVQVPDEFTKNGEPYRVAYIAKTGAGQAGQEDGAARWLLELFLAPGGARDRFIEEVSDDVDASALFLVNPRRGAFGHGERHPRTSLAFADNALSNEWRTMVTTFAPELGIDLQALRTIHGGLGVHSARYLFGRYWAHERQMLEYASDMLHHGDLVITKMRYVGTDATSRSHDVTDTRDRNDQEGATDRRLLRLEEENAMLRALLSRQIDANA